MKIFIPKRAEEDLSGGFRAQMSFEEGLENTIKYFEENVESL